jgi:mannose-6-phosphate isomerase-like protein (cupin superfamily)
MSSPIKFSLTNALNELAAAPEDYTLLHARGDMRLVLFGPEGKDTQTPHAQDELYVVASGSGTFRRGEEVVDFVAGDVLFVGAGVPHCFEDFSDDFRTWVVFFGPAGGVRE